KRLLRIVFVLAGGAAATAFILEWLRRQRTPADYPLAASLLRKPYVDAVVIPREGGGVDIRWDISADSVTVYSGSSPGTINMGFPLATITDDYVVTVADSQQPRYFALRFTGGDRDGETVIVAERELTLEGAVNFRDVGGYRTADYRYVQWGRVYRAGQLASLTERDHTLLQALNLKFSCDLRLDEEVKEAPDKLPDGVTLERIPVQSGETRSEQIRRLMKAQGRMDEFMRGAYRQVIVDGNPQVFAQVFRRIADESNLPLVVHCTAGKDRTGVAVALLLDVLGVPDDVIAADYSLSNHYYETFVELGEDAIKSVSRLGFTVENMQPLFTADPETILATLAHIRSTHGSTERYLIDAGGLEPDVIDTVREIMLTD
ncbi:MAG: tyrosine-protein phosphatase, partial [Chloroflexota bacterium]